MINLWKEGFKTETYSILGLTPLDEMELMILYDYCKSFMIEYERETTDEKGVVSKAMYQKLDQDKIKSLIKSKDVEFSEKLDEMVQLLCNLIGEEQTKTLAIYEIFYTITNIYLEIAVFKSNLKKK